jgi:hypothetical protein
MKTFHWLGKFLVGALPLVGLAAPLSPLADPVPSPTATTASSTTSSTAEERLNELVEGDDQDANRTEVEWVEEYIRRYVALAPEWPPNKLVLERARDMAELIVTSSLEHDVDPRLTTVLVRCESGFREGALEGKTDKGDFGVLQVHGDRSSSTAEQLDAGLKALTECRAQCRSLTGTLSCYQTGRCSPDTTVPRQERKARGIAYRLSLLRKIGVTRL